MINVKDLSMIVSSREDQILKTDIHTRAGRVFVFT